MKTQTNDACPPLPVTMWRLTAVCRPAKQCRQALEIHYCSLITADLGTDLKNCVFLSGDVWNKSEEQGYDIALRTHGSFRKVSSTWRKTQLETEKQSQWLDMKLNLKMKGHAKGLFCWANAVVCIISTSVKTMYCRKPVLHTINSWLEYIYLTDLIQRKQICFLCEPFNRN